MRILLLLVFMSVLSLTRTQTTIAAEESTAETTTVLESTAETTTVLESTAETTTVLESTAETTTVRESTAETTKVLESTAETTNTVLETTTENTTILETTTLANTSAAVPWTAPAIFYPFGSAAGDTEHSLTFDGDESYVYVGLSTPYTFFGHTYNQLYVHFNGLLTFSQPQPASAPSYNPTRGVEDYIAPLWADIDEQYRTIMFSYQQYTNGSVLTRATQDINQYFPQMTFTASSVFVVTWQNGLLQPNLAILFQVVLISGGGHSFFLMNYGDCAMLYETIEAGYDTINSVSQFVIPDSTNGNYQNLKNTSNVNVPGRWAFISTENLIGVKMRFTSYLDLTQSGEIAAVLQQIKQELVSLGLPSSIRIRIRNVKKIQP